MRCSIFSAEAQGRWGGGAFGPREIPHAALPFWQQTSGRKIIQHWCEVEQWIPSKEPAQTGLNSLLSSHRKKRTERRRQQKRNKNNWILFIIYSREENLTFTLKWHPKCLPCCFYIRISMLLSFHFFSRWNGQEGKTKTKLLDAAFETVLGGWENCWTNCWK